MAQLTIISETGMFHSACRCTFGTSVQWYGFKPKAHRSPKGPGFVDRSDRTSSINHTITFEVDDALLRSAISAAVGMYDDTEYTVGVRDCVSFSADLARKARLRVPSVNISPYGFIQTLALWNEYVSKT